MNVLFISVRSDIGGGPKHLLDLLKNLSHRDLEVYAAIPINGEYASQIQELSKETFPIPYRKFNFLSYIRLLFFCRDKNISIIHSHGRGAGLYSRLLKIFGYRTIHTFHGVHSEKTFLSKLKLLVDLVLVPLTDIFICVSRSEKAKVLKNKIGKKEKIVVIENGVVLPLEAKALEIKKTITIGTLSRLNFQKGLDILIPYILRFEREEWQGVHCLIAGEGELKAKLQSQDKELKIKFLGNVDPISFLDSVDIYISFARWEGLPIAVLEAMAVGVPCLVSDVDGNKDLIFSGRNGYLFQLDSYTDFRDKLMTLMNNLSLRKEISSQARIDVESNYNLDIMCDKVFSVYKQILKRDN